MDISEWRDKIDEIDRKLVELLNARSQCSIEIGKLKRVLGLPIYEPRREEMVFENTAQVNRGPLQPGALRRIFERIIDESRSIQRAPMEKPAATDSGVAANTELNEKD